MIEQKTIINKDGFVVEKNVVFIDGVAQYYKLKDGEKAVELLTKTQTVNNQIVPCLKPQWNGTEWIETATEEELNLAYRPIEVQKTELEILKETVEALVLANLGV